MRDGCALLLRDKEYNDADSEQTRHERESKQAWVVVIKGTQQPQCASGTDNRGERVQHSLEAKGRPCVSRVTAAGSSALRTGVRTQRPSQAAAPANKTCHAVVASPIAECRDEVTEHGDEFAARQFVSVVA
jgi:hypothetical protein